MTRRLLRVLVGSGAAMMLIVWLSASGVGAQAPQPEDHEQHHPPADSPAPQPSPTPSGLAPPAPSLGAAPAAEMNMERMMKEMERMMGAPPKKPLVSQLLDVERLSESERNSLRGDADRQLEEGMRLLQEAIREADQARRKGDSSAVERAMAKLREGATHWDTGYAVQRALTTPPPAARESAVKWFKAQMDVDAQPPTPTGLPWGVSWMHLAVMSAFALLAAGSIALYTYRVRRALSLLGRLTRGDEPR